MNAEASKVTSDHVRRNAYLYVRQSSLHQVMENTESTKRQYDLQQRAIALGWPLERVSVIDQDLGQSAAGTAQRAGFQRLVAEVGMGKAGIVLGLEVSRLARTSAEWHRLLEICALTDTLILDEEGIYDPAHFNDRLLLGLKGTMSEAELHVLRARLLGGIRSKARRGELKIKLPVGFVYDAAGRVARDPDQRVRDAVTLFFETFRRTGSAWATVRHFETEDLLFPFRLRSGSRKGELVFLPLRYGRAIKMLHNPRYTGAFVYGRSRSRRTAERGVIVKHLPRQDWQVLIPDAHDGYISWAEYEANVARLRENAQALGQDRRSPPREGPALLQGLAVCGRCGERMHVKYHTRLDGTRRVSYTCPTGQPLLRVAPRCQALAGRGLDEAISSLLVEVVTPLTLEVALAVGDELQTRAEEVDGLRRRHVEHARYQTELAAQRYRRVDPDHRLVADALEADWNDRLRELADAQEQYERQRESDRMRLDEQQRREIISLATDFPRLWRDSRTPHHEKKRIARLLIEDVTVTRDKQITAHVRFKGGATRTLHLPLPRGAPDLRRTEYATVQKIDQLLDQHTEDAVAALLNAEGMKTGTGLPFTVARVRDARVRHHLKSHYQRRREAGLFTTTEIAVQLGVAAGTVRRWCQTGLLRAHKCGPIILCEALGSNRPTPQQGKKLLRATSSQ
jgi:DNA invertase Pin-like site-specific DNA recombinase